MEREGPRGQGLRAGGSTPSSGSPASSSPPPPGLALLTAAVSAPAPPKRRITSGKIPRTGGSGRARGRQDGIVVGSGGGEASIGRDSSLSSSIGTWQCARCTFLNERRTWSSASCEMCEGPRTGSRSSSSTAPSITRAGAKVAEEAMVGRSAPLNDVDADANAQVEVVEVDC